MHTRAHPFTQLSTCFMCGKQMSEPLVIPGPAISGYYAFHVESTHGIPREFLADWINAALAATA